MNFAFHQLIPTRDCGASGRAQTHARLPTCPCKTTEEAVTLSPSTICIIIFVLCIISFALEKIPLGVTALVGGIFLAATGIIDTAAVYSSLGNQAVAIIIGTCLVGMGLEKAGITDLVGKGLSKTGVTGNERAFVLVVFLVTSALSAFLSNSAVVAMFIPIIQSMSRKSNGIVKQKHGLMVAGLGSAAGGCLTLAGTATIVIGSNACAESGVEGARAFTFLEVGYCMLPVVIMMAVYFGTVGYSLMKKALAPLPDNPLDDMMGADAEEPDAAYPFWKKIVAGLTAVYMIVGFATNMFGDIGVVALVASAIMLVTGIIPWKDALRELDWNTVLVLGFSSALATGLNTSGAGAMIANSIVNAFGGPEASPALLLFICIAVGTVLTNFMGNAALIIAMIPICLNVAVACGANPMCFALATTVACNLAFSTPIGTACVTQTLVGGYRYMDYVKVGLPVNIAAIVVVALVSPVVYGL